MKATINAGRPRQLIALSVAVALAMLVLDGSPLRPTPAEAATFLVTTDDDAGDGTCDATCTLRDAIIAANATPADDEITFAPTITDIQLNAALGQLTVADSAAAGSLTIDGAGGVTVRRHTAGSAHRIFLVNVGGDLALIGITVTGGSVVGADDGGGILNNGGTLSLRDSTVSANTAGDDGGGIFNSIGGTVTLRDSTISANTAGEDGGGIRNVGTLTLTNSTVSGNTAGSGGGILSFGAVTLTNSTVSGNTAGFAGGGIFNPAGSTLTLTNSTVSRNTAGTSGGGIFNPAGATSTLTNTIVAGQAAGADCSGGGVIISVGHNLESGISCGFDIQNADPLLGALAENGGPTETHALLAGSPALDAGNDTVCTDPPVNGLDQRGVPRPQGVACDIGAYEAVLDADLLVAMTCEPLQAAPDTFVVCTIAVTNAGFIVDASLSLTVPLGTTFVSLDEPGDPWECETPAPGGTGEVSCDPNLPADTTSTFVLTLQVDPDAAPGMAILVEVVVDSPDPNVSPVNATVLITVAGAPRLTVTKVCLGASFDATFILSAGGQSQAVACGGTATFPDLAPGPRTLAETIIGPDATGFATVIACGGAAPVAGTSGTVAVPETGGVACVVINAFAADSEAEDLLALLKFLPLEIDNDNDNRNVMGIDNDNSNDNGNANSNANDNDNTNTNENDNQNENSQDQDNAQDQNNANEQTNNITSGPEVNIDFGD